MRITQGTFSYLPPLTETEIRVQVQYMIDRGWAVAVEFTEDPHPRNVYWHMWTLPLFDLEGPEPVMREIAACRAAHPAAYIKVNGYDPSPVRQGQALSFLVQRPPGQANGYGLTRAEVQGQVIQYTVHPRAGEPPAGGRPGAHGDGERGLTARTDEAWEGGWGAD